MKNPNVRRCFFGMNQPVFLKWFGYLAVALAVLCIGLGTRASASEYRAFWVDAFGTGFLSQNQVDTLLGVPGTSTKGQLRDVNCNSVFVQVRRRANVCYPSGMGEPYMSGLSPANFNALAAIIKAAHDTTGGKKRIEVHCWMVTFKTDKGQVYSQHSDINNLDNYWPTRLGSTTGAENADGSFDPGHPKVLQYIVNVALDLAAFQTTAGPNGQDGKVDGIHFDYIRFEANNEGYNPTSVARFNERYGLTGQPAAANELFKQWRRDQVTAVVRQTYAKVQKSNPSIKVSGALITWNPSPTSSTREGFTNTRPYYDIYSDWDSWTQEGILDMAVTMNYYDWASLPNDYTRWMNFQRDRKGNRQTIIGPGTYHNNLDNAILELQLTRNASPAGNYAEGYSGYCYRNPYYITWGASPVYGSWANLAARLLPDVNPTWDDIPTMPWKTAPTTGHMMGVVTLAGSGAWADHAVVSVSGPVERSMYVDGMGFYAFIDLPPGSYQVTASKSGFRNATATVNVQVGEVAGNMYEQNLVLLTNAPPLIDTHPESQTVRQGSNASFAVTASGTLPMAYKWLFNGVAISGATTDTYTRANVQANDAGSYWVVVTNAFGSATSSVALLTVETNAIPPSIVAQPEGTNVMAGQTASFLVGVDGTAPFAYQWRFNGANITGATASSFSKVGVQVADAGSYSVYVTNAAGSVLSADAVLFVGEISQGVTVSNVWKIQAGSRAYVSTSNKERGLAVNAVSNHVLVASRSTTPSSINVLNADTGAEVTNGGSPIKLNVTGVSGGTFDLNKIGVADDGIVYAANLTTTSGTVPFTIYRWANYSSAPVVAYTGAPDSNVTPRWGDTMAVRGTGTNTQIIVSGSASTCAVIFKTSNGINFTPVKIVPASPDDAYDLSKGLCWGSGNTFYAKNRLTTTGKQLSFDLNAGTYSTVVDIPSLDTDVIAVGADLAHNLLAGVTDDLTTNAARHSLVIYDVSNPAFPVAVSNFYFLPLASGACTANANWGAHVDFGAGKFVALDTQNGIVAVKVESAPATVPQITTQPISQTNSAGASVQFSVVATGSQPITFQWRRNGIALSDDVQVSGSLTSTLSISNLQGENAGTYSVAVSNSGGTVTSADAVLRISPIITSGPSTQTVGAGTNAMFDVAASGETPLNYQWKRNGVPVSNNGRISGATSSTLTLLGVTQSDAGSYSAVVSNAAGQATSEPGTLTVIDPPAISLPLPVSSSINAGTTFNAGITANGTVPLSYQWRKNGVNLTDGGRVSGTQTPTLTISSVQGSDSGTYTVLVANAAGTASSSTTLTVTDPVFTSQPTSRTVNAGSSTLFTAAAAGTSPLVYRWQKNGINLAEGGNTIGVASPNLTINNVAAGDAGTYRVVVTNVVGAYATSSGATLSVVVPPTISVPPASATIAAGNSAIFNVAASGTAPLTYQWKRGGANLTNGGKITGATSAALTVANVSQSEAGDYTVVVSNAAGTNNSAVATLTVIDAPSIAVQPASVTVNAGSSATLTVNASGNALSYQWKKGSVVLSNGGKIAGATTSTLTVSDISQAEAGGYSVVISNLAGTNTSATATITVIDPPAIVLHPTSVTGNAGTAVSFTVSATGTSLNYQWKKGTTALSNGGKFSGTTMASLTVSNISQAEAGDYSVVVSNAAGTNSSSTATLTVIDPPSIIAQPSSVTGNAGSAAVFNVTATGTSVSYQWKKGAVALSNGGKFVGANTASLTISNLSQTEAGDYSVVVSNTAGTNSSSTATLIVIDPPSVVAHPSDVVGNAGSTAVFNVAATGTSVLYQWKKGAAVLSNGGKFAGVTTANLTVSNISQNEAGNYCVVVSNPAGTNSSSTAILTVIDPPSITAQPSSVTVNAGSTAVFNVSAIGTSISYQWKKGTVALSDGGKFEGVTTAALTISDVSQTEAGDYSVIVSNAAGTNTSSAAVLTVVVAPTLIEQPTNLTVAVGGDAIFDVTASGTGLNYQWKKDTAPLTDNARVFGATSARLTLADVVQSDAGTYMVVVSNSAGTVSCIPATLTVIGLPEIISQPLSRTNLTGTTALFSISATGAGNLGYQWRKGAQVLADDTRISGATSPQLVISALTQSDAGAYTAVVTNAAGSVTSAVCVLTIAVQPTITIQPESCTNVAGTAATFAVAAGGGGLSYQWKRGATNLVDGINVAGANSPALTLLSVASADAGSDYSVLVTNIAGSVASSLASLTVLNPPQIVQQPSNTSVLFNGTAVLQVKAQGPGTLKYHWRRGTTFLANGGKIFGATTNSLTIIGVTHAEAGEYSVVVTNVYGAVTSSPARVKIVPKVTVTSPSSGSFNSSVVLVKGTAADAGGGIDKVLFQLNGGEFQPASGTANWTAAFSLRAGTNTFAVKCINAEGNESAVVNRTFFMNVYTRLTLITNGIGGITGVTNGQMLLVGKGYKLTARPGLNQVLSNWTGTVTSSANPFSFIMQTNMVVQGNFIPNPFLARTGIYNGLFYEDSEVNHERSGFFSISLTSAGVFSGKLVLGGVTRSLRGKFAVDGTSHVVLTSAPPVIVDLSLDVSGTSGRVSGLVSGENWAAALFGDRAKYVSSALSNHTVVLMGTSDGLSSPGGDGFANLTIKTNGAVVFRGRLSDDLAFSMPATYASVQGDFPVYVPLFKTNGSLLGWLTNGQDHLYQGRLSWIKKPGIGTNYTAGFTNELFGSSSKFSVLTSTSRPLNLTNAAAILSGGGLSWPITNHVRLTNSSLISVVPGQTNGLVLKLSLSTGQVSGSFTNPVTRQKMLIKGILLQGQKEARGYFLPPQTGAFILQGE